MSTVQKMAGMAIGTFAMGFLYGVLFGLPENPNLFGWAVVIVSFGVLVFSWTFVLIKKR